MKVDDLVRQHAPKEPVCYAPCPVIKKLTALEQKVKDLEAEIQRK